MIDSPILIAGGGIGGLSTALCLSKQRIPCHILEKSSSLGEIGAGIQLGPNAFTCFEYMGVADEARRMAVYIDSLRLMDAMTGQSIATINLEEQFRQTFANPYAVVHRGELHSVLLRACKQSDLISISTNAEVFSYALQEKGVTAHTGAGDRFGSALVAADGLWSAVRKQMYGSESPRISGHTTYRAVIKKEDMPKDLRWNSATLWAGAKCHLVHYPLSDWNSFNLVITRHNDAREVITGEPIDKELVLKEFSAIHETPQQIIHLADEWKQWVLCDRNPIENWIDQEVVLLGDAAHPMMQYMAQGACMAMEDAVVLSMMIKRHTGNINQALQDYQKLRVPRTTRVLLSSRAMGEHVYHPEGAHAQMRNAVLGSWDDNEFYSRLNWLYGNQWFTEVENSQID